jgi:hypothetical protein
MVIKPILTSHIHSIFSEIIFGLSVLLVYTLESVLALFCPGKMSSVFSDVCHDLTSY